MKELSLSIYELSNDLFEKNMSKYCLCTRHHDDMMIECSCQKRFHLDCFLQIRGNYNLCKVKFNDLFIIHNGSSRTKIEISLKGLNKSNTY